MTGALLALALAAPASAGAWAELTAPLRSLGSPSNDRDWSEDVAVLAEVRLSSGRAWVKNARNFDYRSPTEWTPRYYDADFELDAVRTVWYFVEPFAAAGQAHTFLSFGFADGRYLAVSVEVRKRKGDSFSPWRGLFNGFELIYVLGDERDIVRLRSNYRKDDVYLYPVRASREQARALLVDILERVRALRDRPEFYNTITNSCMSNIVRHVDRIAPRPVPRSYKLLLPGYSDRLAYDVGLLDVDVPYEEARRRARINERALAADGDPAFSAAIRR